MEKVCVNSYKSGILGALNCNQNREKIDIIFIHTKFYLLTWELQDKMISIHIRSNSILFKEKALKGI